VSHITMSCISVTVQMTYIIMVIISMINMSDVTVSNITMSVILMVRVRHIRVRRIFVNDVPMRAIRVRVVLMVRMSNVTVPLPVRPTKVQPGDAFLVVNPNTTSNASRLLDERVENPILEVVCSDVIKKIRLNPQGAGKSNLYDTNDSLALILPLTHVTRDKVKGSSFHPNATRDLSHYAETNLSVPTGMTRPLRM